AEADLSENAPWRSDGNDKQALCDHLYRTVCDEYEQIEQVMVGFQPEGTKYEPPNSFQPWVTSS
ncbi:MAG: hypothetical protein SGPRY_012944, partial [Prymnesium sp.]